MPSHYNESKEDFKKREQPAKSTNDKVFDVMQQASSDSVEVSGAKDYVEEVNWEPLGWGDKKLPDWTKSIIAIGADNPDAQPGLYEWISQSSPEEKKMIAMKISASTESYMTFLHDMGLYEGPLDYEWGPQMDKADSLFTILQENDMSLKQMKLYAELSKRNREGQGPHRDAMLDNPDTFRKWYEKTKMLTKDEYLDIYREYSKDDAEVIREFKEELQKRARTFENRIMNWWNRDKK